MKNARLIVVSGSIAMGLIGCGGKPDSVTIAPPPQAVQPVATPPAPQPAPAAAQQTTNEAPAPAREAQPDAIARQAEAHAKAIEDLMVARAKQDSKNHGVKIIEPPPVEPDMKVVAMAPPPPSRVTGVARTDAPEAKSPEATANLPLSVASASGTPGAPGTASEPRLPAVIPDRTVNKTDESLEQRLARRAREYPRDLSSQLNYQLALFLKDETVPRNADLANLPTEDRELLTALLDGLVNFRNTADADSNQLMTRKIRPLLEMADRVRSRSDLSIPTALLCREVKGFGAYTPVEGARFAAGTSHKLILYCEVENFASQMNDKNLWETKLAHELVLYTESGLPVWEDKQPEVSDTCRNRRRDFFIARRVEVPANLNMGRYVLKVSVIDKQSNRVAETSIPISIVSK